MRKILFTVPAAVLALTAFTSDVSAQTTDSTTSVTYEVKAINEISVTGSPSLVITTGSELSGVSDAATSTWSVTTNETGKKITGKIATDMEAGVTLKVNLTAPSVGTSAGAVALTAVDVDLVTGVGEVEATGLGMTYTLSATPEAGVIAATTKKVTYTITAGV